MIPSYAERLPVAGFLYDAQPFFALAYRLQLFCTHVSEKKGGEDKKLCVYFALFGRKVKNGAKR